MARKELSYEECISLENSNLSYKEMIEVLDIKIAKKTLISTFKQYNIHHKTKSEIVAQQIKQNNDYDKSLRFLARKYKCSIGTARKVLLNDKNKN